MERLSDPDLLDGCPRRPWLREVNTSRAFGVERADQRGRVRVTLGAGHRFANSAGWAWRSSLVVCYALGRRLRTDEHVHHLDGVVYHDAAENLEVVLAEYHGRHHARLQTLAGCRGPDGRFVELAAGHPPPRGGARLGAIISDRDIGPDGPERRACAGPGACSVCGGAP